MREVWQKRGKQGGMWILFQCTLLLPSGTLNSTCCNNSLKLCHKSFKSLMARCKELLNCILLRKVLNFWKRVRKVLIEWYQFDTSFKYMTESLILDPINFNIICILLDYNFGQLLIRITFKLTQLFMKYLKTA